MNYMYLTGWKNFQIEIRKIFIPIRLWKSFKIGKIAFKQRRILPLEKVKVLPLKKEKEPWILPNTR